MSVADPASIQAQGSRLQELKAFVIDLSGADLADADGDASFLELGFDSLFLTQLTQAIQAKYRVKLTFRQIMEDYPTLGALACHLDRMAPAQTSAPATAAVTHAVQPAVQTPAATPSSFPIAAPSASGPATGNSQPSLGSFEALFAGQMQMMNSLFSQQLQLLRGQQNGATATPPPLTEGATSAQVPGAASIGASGFTSSRRTAK